MRQIGRCSYHDHVRGRCAHSGRVLRLKDCHGHIVLRALCKHTDGIEAS